MIVTVNGLLCHLIAYYTISNAEYRLKTPRDNPRLKDIQVRDALLDQQRFNSTNIDDIGDGNFNQMNGSEKTLESNYFQNEYEPSPMHLALPHNVYQVQPFQPFPCQGVYPPAHFPPADTSPFAMYPYANAASCQQPAMGPQSS